jgi:hypothetical protein
MSLTRWLRRLRHGRPIIIVSGLPRSGTSMMMQMLAAGGVAVVSDGVRTADASNPSGYFELEAVKTLDKPGDRRWLAGARGRAVKVVSPLLEHLPESFDYRVIFMERPLAEVLASQDAMLARIAGGETASPVLRSAQPHDLVAEYERHLRRVHALLTRRRCFTTLIVSYRDTIADPRSTAERVSAFVGGLDVEAMAAAVREQLYRQRSAR